MISARILLVAALAACPGLGASGPALSQTIPSSYRFIEKPQEVSLFWGALSLSQGSLELGPRSGSAMGARYSIEASGPLFIQGLLTWLPTERDVIDPRRVAGDRRIGTTDVQLLMADVRLDFSLTGRRTWNRIAPHLFLGGGIAMDLAGQGEFADALLPEDLFEFGTAFTTSAGAGVRVALGSRLMLYGESGLTLWQLHTPDGFDDPAKRIVDDEGETRSVVQSEWVRGYGLSLSLGWRF